MQIENEEATEEKGITIEEIESELGVDLDEYYYNYTGYMIHW
jgi:hypothetical protein